MIIRGLSLGYVTVLVIACAAAALPIPGNNRGDSFVMIAALLIPIFVAAYLARLLVTRHPHPTRKAVADLTAHWPKLMGATVVYLSMALSLEVFSGIKKSIPFVVPFYLDPFLIDLDRAIFFGTDPWRLSHAVFGWATQPIAWIYNTWHLLHIGMAIWIAFAFNEAQKIRFAMVLQFVWIFLGGGLAMLLSSVGPIMVGDFYGDRSFDPMLATLQAQVPTVIAVKDTLIDTMDDPLLISGISAMPSIHVAIAVTTALWLQGFKIRALTLAGWAYATVIYVGSIHLGWHYATDGLLSAPLVLVAWWLSGKYVRWLETREFALGKPASPTLPEA
ncbi:MAG: phosphatase PAP2 family protein [Pseudomonadota bacterium]